MTLALLYVFAVALGCFLISRLALDVLVSKMQGRDYALKYDAWLYLLGIIFLAAMSVCFFTPNLYDQIAPLSPPAVALTVLAAGILYLAFTVDIRWVLDAAIVCATLMLLFFLPTRNIVLPSGISIFLDRLLLGLLIIFLTRTAPVLNKQNGIFIIYALTICFGIILIALFSGAPLVLGGLSAVLAGVLSGFFNINALTQKIALNKGACISAAFLLCALLLDLCVEYSTTSALILSLYLPIEFFAALFGTFLHKKALSDFESETIYNRLFEKNSSLPAIWTALAKIGLMNMVLAVFQLYAPNQISLPFFALLLNLWLLSRLFGASEPPSTIKSANQQLFDAIKQGLKDTFGKE